MSRRTANQDGRTPVLFRAETRKPYEVTAVFPCDPGTGAGDFSAYSHIGQHSTASRGWLIRTRPATPDEYADLREELERIGYKLDVRQRVTAEMDTVRATRAAKMEEEGE